MNVADFKTMVAGYMTRNTTDFVDGAVDQLLQAINNARKEGQMTYAFLRLRDEGFISTSILGADFTTAVKATPGGAAMYIRHIEKVWTYNTRTISAGTLYERAAEVDFRTSRNLSDGLPMAGSSSLSERDYYRTDVYSGRTKAWVKGQKLYSNAEASTSYMVDVYKWLPELAGSETEDFFITYGSHWLLYKTIQILNGYVKEDQRVAISQKALTDAWETLTNFDSQVANSNDSNDLE